MSITEDDIILSPLSYCPARRVVSENKAVVHEFSSFMRFFLICSKLSEIVSRKWHLTSDEIQKIYFKAYTEVIL